MSEPIVLTLSDQWKEMPPLANAPPADGLPLGVYIRQLLGQAAIEVPQINEDGSETRGFCGVNDKGELTWTLLE